MPRSFDVLNNVEKRISVFQEIYIIKIALESWDLSNKEIID